jgi:sugar (pentulose or hexulose) kinase
MAQEKEYIAVDLGAESGRVMLGSVCDDKLSLEEIHRFSNGPIKPSAQGPRLISPRPWAGGLRWDFDRLLSEVKTGIGKAAKKADKLAPAKAGIAGIGVDSWGVDFGLLGADGKLLENPYHYRDSRTNGMMEKAFALMGPPPRVCRSSLVAPASRDGSRVTGNGSQGAGKRQIYESTGIQFMQLNSVYQLLAMRLANSPVLAKTKKLIFIGDLFSYYLCDRAFGEYTLASTSQLMDMRTGKWSQEMFDRLSLPIEIMPDIIEPGTVVGKLAKPIAEKLGCGQIPIIAVASHDTASAVAAVPAGENNWAYLSSGTWSLMGVEVPKAIVNDKTFQYEFTNEGGVENTIRLLKNIMGLWLVQECKRQWEREGVNLSYDQLTEMAQKAKPFGAHIEVDRSEFLAPGDMPKRINDHLAETGQKTIQDKGQMIRAILEALAFSIAQCSKELRMSPATKLTACTLSAAG